MCFFLLLLKKKKAKSSDFPDGRPFFVLPLPHYWGIITLSNMSRHCTGKALMEV